MEVIADHEILFPQVILVCKRYLQGQENKDNENKFLTTCFNFSPYILRLNACER